MQVQFAGQTVTLRENPLQVGDQLPDFKLVAGNLQDKSLADFPGKLLILTFPSVDTDVCAMELAKFNREVEKLDGFVTLAVSMDLPFAQARWCQAKAVHCLETLSDFRSQQFARDYGVYIEGVGLLARAVFVADEKRRIVYAEYCDDIGTEPNYQAALEAAKKI